MGRKLTDRQAITLLKEKLEKAEASISCLSESNRVHQENYAFVESERKRLELELDETQGALQEWTSLARSKEEELGRRLARLQVLEEKLKNSMDAQERYREMLRKRTDAQARMSREMFEGRRANIAATLMSTMSRGLFGDSARQRAEKAVLEADILLQKLGMRRPQ
jgi:chromosome segregation ATPase